MHLLGSCTCRFHLCKHRHEIGQDVVTQFLDHRRFTERQLNGLEAHRLVQGLIQSGGIELSILVSEVDISIEDRLTMYLNGISVEQYCGSD